MNVSGVIGGNRTAAPAARNVCLGLLFKADDLTRYAAKVNTVVSDLKRCMNYLD